MLVGSIIPWLNDPFGPAYKAWQLPIYLSWSSRVAVLNYGTLCACCALLLFAMNYAQYKPFRGSHYLLQQHVYAGVACLVPVLVFFTQYLFTDVQGINQLAQHKIQMLLIESHYNYRTGAQILSIKPFTLNIAQLGDRLSLLTDQLSFGVFFPCISSWMLFAWGRTAGTCKRSKYRKIVEFTGILALIILLARGPISIACENWAENSLSTGNYADALVWLDRATFFDPSLETAAFFHIDRGEASYFLHPKQLDDDSHIYLASMYQDRKNYVVAYQQIQDVLNEHKSTSPWIKDEISVTLEELTEGAGVLKQYAPELDAREVATHGDYAALKWLQPLTKLYPDNVYALYMLGRIHYELHSYSLSTFQMHAVTQMSSNADLLSSAYTYVALSDMGQGNYALGRKELLTAIAFDPNYRNTSAREEMSGIR